MNTTTNVQLAERFRQFKSAAKSLRTFCSLLGTDHFTLKRLGTQPRYRSFLLPKSTAGDFRHIEDPPPLLKKVQSALNFYLQSVYYFEKSYAGYGFVVNAATDEDKRNILTNARRHLKKPYLLQYDLKDFFHAVTTEMVYRIFEEPPLCFNEELCDLLTPVCIWQGRLPMGAPTSPVLSNLACRDIDDQLVALAETKLWTFTRFADDLSFSASRSFSADDQYAIRAIVEEAGFLINDLKTRLSGPTDEKIVTGILLRGKGELRPGFYEETQRELEELAVVLRAQHYHGELRTHWTEKMKQQVRGKIAFIGFVLGVRDQRYIHIKDDFYTASTPPEDEFGAVSWKGFNYLK